VGHGSRRFPLNRGLQWSDTVGSTLWEGGACRCRPGYRPWSCEDRASRPANLCRRRGNCWCMVFHIQRSGIRWALRIRVLHVPAVAMVGRAVPPDPLVGVRACTLGGPGDSIRAYRAPLPEGHVMSPNPFPSERRVRLVGVGRIVLGSSAEPVLSCIAGPTVLLQQQGRWSGDRGQRMGPRSHPLWEGRSDAARPWCRGGVAGL
jgi:hypothetical protein